MRVVLLVPRIHFHAPFVLRALAPRARRGEDAYLVVTTPKLPPLEEPLPRKLSRILRRSGPDYLASMALSRLLHLVRGALETIAGRPADARRSLSVGEASRLLGAETIAARRVSDPALAERVRSFRPDLLCAVFFNQIVPPALLDLAPLGGINVHPSRLPLYRGVSPCFWVLARGETSTGVTVHRLTAEIDRGPILARASVEIEPPDTVDSLYRRCALAGGRLLAGLLADPARLAGPAEAAAEPGSSCPAVTREAVRELRARGRRFMGIM